jgi:hypothetical protein
MKCLRSKKKENALLITTETCVRGESSNEKGRNMSATRGYSSDETS